MLTDILTLLVFIGGLGHIMLSLGSLIIPSVLKWKEHLSTLRPLLKQMFWTYAAYIFVINLCFGLISITGTAELLDGSFLARCITLFISIYWLSRIAIQFLYFDKSDAPKGFIYVLGEVALVFMFILFTIIYFAAFLYNMAWI